MYKLCIIVVVALIVSEAMTFIIKPQLGAVPLVSINDTAPSTTVGPAYTIVFNNIDDANATVSDFAMSIVTQQCLEDCPTTSDNNPVCGSDGVVYANQLKLFCAQVCGKDVKMIKVGPC